MPVKHCAVKHVIRFFHRVMSQIVGHFGEAYKSFRGREAIVVRTKVFAFAANLRANRLKKAKFQS
jgi:hypothetical protein